jgi:hypothetical protein
VAGQPIWVARHPGRAAWRTYWASTELDDLRGAPGAFECDREPRVIGDLLGQVFKPRDSCWWQGAGSVRCAMTLLSTLLSWADRAGRIGHGVTGVLRAWLGHR